MKKLSLACFLLVGFSGLVLAQAKPDLSGEWIGDSGRNGPGVPVVTRTITQTNDVFEVALKGGPYITSRPTRWALDGSPTNPAGETTLTAKWEGNVMVLTAHAPTREVVTKYSLDGAHLKCETIRRTAGTAEPQITIHYLRREQ
jgi:hypothetical protein